MSDDGRGLMPAVQPGEPEGPWRTLAHVVLDAVGEILMSVLLLGSVVGVYVGSRLAYRTSPAATLAVGAVLAAFLVYGGWIRTRPSQRRGRFGRFAAAATGAVGLWMVACLVVLFFYG